MPVIFSHTTPKKQKDVSTNPSAQSAADKAALYNITATSTYDNCPDRNWESHITSSTGGDLIPLKIFTAACVWRKSHMLLPFLLQSVYDEVACINKTLHTICQTAFHFTIQFLAWGGHAEFPTLIRQTMHKLLEALFLRLCRHKTLHGGVLQSVSHPSNKSSTTSTMSNVHKTGKYRMNTFDSCQNSVLWSRLRAVLDLRC